MQRIGRKRQLNQAIQRLHFKTLAAYPGKSKPDIPIPKSQVLDFLLKVPTSQRQTYIDILIGMSKVDETKLQDLSRQMVEYYSRYLP